jgi:hypothetical protein
MNGKDLEAASDERDLGVIVQQDLKRNKQCLKSVSTANRILGMTNRTFRYLSKDAALKLYKSLVPPYLVLFSGMETIFKKKYRPRIDRRVQRRATKLTKSLNNEKYENRLMKLHLTSMGHKKIAGRFDRSLRNVQGKR